MKLIDKHLLREYLVPFTYSLCAFCMLYVVASLFGKGPEFFQAGSGVSDVLYFYMHYLISCGDLANISFLVFLLPVSLLAGSLYSLSCLARNNELTAMRASGMSIYRLMYPFLAMGLVCSLIAMVTQEVFTPRSNRRVEELNREIHGRAEKAMSVVHNYKYYNRQGRRRWQVGTFDLDHPVSLRDVQVTMERADRTRIANISAQSAVWTNGLWVFYGTTVQKYQPNDQPDGIPTEPNGGLVAMTQLTATPEDLVFEADRWRLEKYTGAFRILAYLRRHPNVQDSELAIRRVDAHTRLAMPWACLVVALLGIPVGAGDGRRGLFAGINFAVIMFIVYYLTIQGATFLGKKEIIWPWLSAWVSNIIFVGIGIGMISRMRR